MRKMLLTVCTLFVMEIATAPTIGGTRMLTNAEGDNKPIELNAK